MDNSSSSAARPALVTEDPELLDQLLRLCAAASVTPDVVDGATRRRQAWARACTVLVGVDQAPAMARLGLTRRDHVVLVSQGVDPAPLWKLAVELRADEVVMLPADQHRLIDHLSDLADGGGRATTVGVIGGCGGAGASTVAAALALTSARSGRRSLLVDADPLAGGIELLVGCEDCAGLRWPEVAATEGRVSASAFRAALPTLGTLPVLSWDRAGPRRTPPGVMHAMVGAAQRGAELVVVDLPRSLDEAGTEALFLSDTLVLVATSEVRGVAAARSVLATLREMSGDVRVVVREIAGSDLTPDAVANALDLPLVGTVATQRCVARAVNDGLGPLGRGALERVCRAVLDTLAGRTPTA
jgi:secretion/DNA translocation related CpaE-like protein